MLPGLKTSLWFYSATLTCFPCGSVGIPWLARRAMALACLPLFGQAGSTPGGLPSPGRRPMLLLLF